MFAATTPKNTPMDYCASTSVNPNPVISLAFVKANYEALESLLRDRRRQMRNNDLQTKLEYISEDYDEEREMEPRLEPTRAAPPPLRVASPMIRRRGGKNTREVATNGASSDRRDSFERSKKSSWDNNKGQKNKDRFSPYRGPNHGLLPSLSKSLKEILSTEKAARSFEPPPKMFGSKRSRDMSKYCHFHEDYGHSDASGLHVNLSKSYVYYVGVDPIEVGNVVAHFNCKWDSLPFLYLGLPVGKTMYNLDSWMGIIERFQNRLTSWKAKNLSIGGILTLIKVVLGNLPTYFLLIFRAPIGVVDILERIRRQGGLRIGSIRAKNLSLIGKWHWRFLNEGDAPWCKVIKAIYGSDGGFNRKSLTRLHRGPWRDILKKETWHSSGRCFMTDFTRLFALENNKDCNLADRWKCFNSYWDGVWDWRCSRRGRSIDDLSVLYSLLQNLKLTSELPDNWRWNLDTTGCFSVNKLSKIIDTLILNPSNGELVFRWNCWVPRKVNVLGWRITRDRLSHLSNLSNRGLDVPSILCPICEDEIEDLSHVLVNCRKVIDV
ncbi:RNA-directed DNA polymerase, eukaryota, reverse transcriptase zinc-binding domain protein [Tanacetum coccineum]